MSGPQIRARTRRDIARQRKPNVAVAGSLVLHRLAGFCLLPGGVWRNR